MREGGGGREVHCTVQESCSSYYPCLIPLSHFVSKYFTVLSQELAVFPSEDCSAKEVREFHVYCLEHFSSKRCPYVFAPWGRVPTFLSGNVSLMLPLKPETKSTKQMNGTIFLYYADFRCLTIFLQRHHCKYYYSFDAYFIEA